jgi:hypothetical protein
MTTNKALNITFQTLLKANDLSLDDLIVVPEGDGVNG